MKSESVDITLSQSLFLYQEISLTTFSPNLMPLKLCCKNLHDNISNRGEFPNPEALTRARYSSFALGLASYIIDTTHPLHRGNVLKNSLTAVYQCANFSSALMIWKYAIADSNISHH